MGNPFIIGKDGTVYDSLVKERDKRYHKKEVK